MKNNVITFMYVSPRLVSNQDFGWTAETDGLVAKSACCASMKSEIQIPTAHVKSQVWLYKPTILIIIRVETVGLLGPAGHQPKSRCREGPCHKGVMQMIKQNRCPPPGTCKHL